MVRPLSSTEHDYVIFRTIVFSRIAVSASFGSVHAKIFPVLVTLSQGVMSPLFGQPESVLSLEQRDHGKSPFHRGEQLDIRSDATISSGMTRIAVLDTAYWPWVLVKGEKGEEWLNFDHVVTAKTVAIAK